MKHSPFLAGLIATLLLMAVPSRQPLQAATALQRCSGADGVEIFTDKACAAFGAESAPIPAAMMTRLTRTFDSVREGDAEAAALVDVVAPPVSRRSPAGGCARSPAQLEQDLRGSLALGDVNRIAESYHWIGLDHADGHRIMARLERMAGKPVHDLHYFDARIVDAAYGSDLYADASGAQLPAGGSAGTLQLQLGGASISVVDLAVERHSGCYFVRF